MSWSPEEAERYLASLEPLGWRLGLERIRLLVSLLGMPQHRYASVHVVGTNGKSSVVEWTAATLAEHGVRTGAYLSPHRRRRSERVRIGGEEVAPGAFAAAVERVAEAVEAANRRLEEGDSVTQFEAATAAAFVALAAARVEVAVIEAGLGGRLDATNVLPSRVTALTSVGLEHTQWLGETEGEIATEKLAVLRDHSTLVLGPVGEGVERLARGLAAERSCRVVPVRGLGPGVRLAAAGRYQRDNFAVALACADAMLDGPLDPARVDAVASRPLRGRVEVVAGDPDVVLDAAHNPAAAAALAEAIGEVAAGRPVVGCVAVLADKDAAGFLEALAPALACLVATEIPSARLVGAGRPGGRTHPAPRLAELARRAGVEAVEAVTDSRAAVERARDLASQRRGVALVCGSHYLLGCASRP